MLVFIYPRIYFYSCNNVYLYNNISNIFFLSYIIEHTSDDVPTMLVEDINEEGESNGGRETGDRPITILRNTLKWGHVCPTAPGTF